MNLLQNQLRVSVLGRIEMKHNGLANLFLGIIYGAILVDIRANMEAPANIGLILAVGLLMSMFTWFLYDRGD